MTMYDPIIARSFSRNEQKKLGHCAFIGCLLIALSICTIFKPAYLSPLSALNLRFSSGVEEMVKVRDTNTNISSPVSSAANTSISSNYAANFSNDHHQKNFSSVDVAANVSGKNEILKVIDANISPPPEKKQEQIKPFCSLTEPISDFCELKGQIVINGKSSTIFISSLQNTTASWKIKPYARKGNRGAMDSVKQWTVKLENPEKIPNCTHTHNSPALLFSTGGYSGNHYHAFSDVFVPLYVTSKKFNAEVQFLATDYKDWWIRKYGVIFNKLSNQKIINIDTEEGTHCFKTALVGLRCYKELGIDVTKSDDVITMNDFRKFLRVSYSLNKVAVPKFRKGQLVKPRLMIISRSKTRVLRNEDNMAKLARKMGYDVVLGDVKSSTNLTAFASLVNSCDVLMGVHGAGLTNMVFLPDNAVVIQVVPYGKIDFFAKLDFGDPSKDMNLRYLEYKIKLNESSLINKYKPDDVVIRDPMSVHKQGWGLLRSVYLEGQDVNLDLHRFRGTLLKALKLLNK